MRLEQVIPERPTRATNLHIATAGSCPLAMKQNPRSKSNCKKAKTVLRLPDFEFAKAAVLNSHTSLDARRG